METPEFIDGIPIDEYRVNMTKIPKDELVRLYKTENKSIKEIARHFKCSYRTIYRRLKRLNIPLNEKRPEKKLKNYLGKNQLTAVLQKNLTIEQIAVKLKTAPYIVRRYIRKYEL